MPSTGRKWPRNSTSNVVLNRKRPGDTVNVTVYRGAKKMEIPVKLGERDGNEAKAFPIVKKNGICQEPISAR